MDPVPVTGLAANFSPVPRMAPPPFGRDNVGGPKALLVVATFSLSFSHLGPLGIAFFHG